MRRCVKVAVATAFALTAMAGAAGASPLSYTSTFDPADVLFNKDGGACAGTNYESATPDTVTGTSGGACASLSFDHLMVGYVVPGDSLLSATLDLYFHDDQDPSGVHGPGTGNPESVSITLNPSSLNQLQDDVVLLSDGTSHLHYNVFAQLLDSGLLSVVLGLGAEGTGQDDFYFERSELTAYWEQGTPSNEIPVPNGDAPEPATLALVGGGFAAALARRRQRVRG
jgi:PEP-CTERM motif